MSLLSALYTGTSGLQANSQELGVVGDNIANANTVGFKAGRASFENALSQSLIGGAGERGLGARMASVQRIMSQGSIGNTGVSTDLALQGEGYFVLKGSYGGQVGVHYTRAGQFTVDADGFLTNLQGLRVQGNAGSSLGTINGALGDLQVGNAASPPVPTSLITVKANLQADAPLAPPWDPADPSASSTFSTGVTVYDSLGQAHSGNIYYSKTADGTWDWRAMTDGAGIVGGTPGVPEEIAAGSLNFDTDGKLVSSSQASNFQPVGATGPQNLAFNFGDDTTGGGTGLLGITQFAGDSTTTFVNQDGATAGTLAAVGVDARGSVVGTFTNGETRVLGQLALAKFTAADRLRSEGGNLLAETVDSGQPTIGAAGEGGRASIVAGALEQSNVDLSTEFVRMIAAQRGFQANSKTITTADQLLSELIALKR